MTGSKKFLSHKINTMEQLTFGFDKQNPAIEKMYEYHYRNPELYDAFKRFTFEAIQSGFRNFGARMIIEKIRWETGVVARDSNFKIDNGIGAFYSRLFMAEFPHFREYFRTRVSVADNIF